MCPIYFKWFISDMYSCGCSLTSQILFKVALESNLLVPHRTLNTVSSIIKIKLVFDSHAYLHSSSSFQKWYVTFLMLVNHLWKFIRSFTHAEAVADWKEHDMISRCLSILPLFLLWKEIRIVLCFFSVFTGYIEGTLNRYIPPFKFLRLPWLRFILGWMSWPCVYL